MRRAISLDGVPASSHPGLGFPKGKTRKQKKAREDREETKVKEAVREACVERDGYCRIGSPLSYAVMDVAGECSGPSEWAHLKARSQTRGQAPELRHSTETSCMLCRKHHRMLDAHEFDMTYLTKRGADGPVAYTFGCGAKVRTLRER